MSESLEQLAGPPIFVVGHHRSGTTWVFDLLSSRDDVAGVFESWLFTRDLGLGGLLHWGQWEPGYVAERERIFGQRAGVAQLASHDEVVGACRDLAIRWFARALEPQHRFLVEKSPDHLYAALEVLEVFPDARFVNVVRDGRDVAVSVQAARAWSPGALSARVTSVREIAGRWRHAMTVSRRVADQLGDRYFEIRYERLRAEPQAVVTELFRFAGIPSVESDVNAAIEAASLAKAETGEDRFRRRGQVGDWRTALSMLDRLIFNRVAGSTLRECGYETSRWWWIKRGTR